MFKHALKVSLFSSLFATATAYAGDMGNALNPYLDMLKRGHFLVQSGFISADQGKNQHVPIDGLAGDDFSVLSGTDQNALIGLGYFLDGHSFSRFNLAYGLNAFYMFATKVKGDVTQETLFTNLSYHYKITNVPIYAAVRALFPKQDERYQVVIDAGIGPNIISTSGFKEYPINPSSLPDEIFNGSTQVAFSANAGIGLRLNQLLPKPVECGYRFFYFGSGQLNTVNSQVRNNLDTGNSYAHSLVCGLVFN